MTITEGPALTPLDVADPKILPNRGDAFMHRY